METIEEIKKRLNLDDVFCDKLLLIESLTMLAKTSDGDARYENLSNDKDLPGSMTNTAFRLRSLIVSLTEEENEIAKNYLGKDYWCPSNFSAGDY